MKKLWLAVGMIAFLSGLIVIALVENAGSPREPEYHGRELTAWLDDLHNPLSSAATQANARLAIQEMRTNAVPFLVQMLHAKDSPFKTKCMALLERQHWVDFHLQSDRQKRSDADRGLMILGPDAKAAIPDLAIQLKDGNLGEVQMAGFILSRIGSSAVPTLEDALTSSNEPTRYVAAEALGNIAEPSSVSNLLMVLKDPDWMTRISAVEALRSFSAQANVVVPALVKSLDDPDYRVQAEVVQTLGSFGEDAGPAFPALAKIVGGTNDDAAFSAALALMEIDFGRALATLTNNLKSSDVTVRRNSARELMGFKSGGEPAVPFLVKCLRDPDAKVRENAAGALREIAADPDLVVPALIAKLNDPDAEVRVVTAIALGRFGERAKPAAPQILKIIEENKGNAATADDGSAEGLYDALHDIDPQAAAKLNGK